MNIHKLIIDALPYKKFKAFGYQEYLFNLLDYFFENRIQLSFDKIIVVCDSSQSEAFTKYKCKFEIVEFHTPSLFKRLIAQSLFPYKLGLIKTDVILFTGNYSSYFKKCKNVLVIHDLLYLRKKLLPNLLFRLQRHLFVPRSVAIADVIIAISNFTKNDILQNINKATNSRIFFIYNYFNFEKYSYTSKYFIRTFNYNFFLCVSSSAYHKNVVTILEAFEKYCFINKEIDLCIVGSLGTSNTFIFYNQLQNAVKKRIHIFSNISNHELSTLYEECEAYISATLFEGLGMSIVEAMYFNAPLILSDIEICREVSDGKAIFFDANNSRKLFEILNNYRKNTIDTRSIVIEKFSAANTSQKYIDILNSI